MADDLDTGMPLEPRGQSRGFSIEQQIDDAMTLHVNGDGPVTPALAESEVVNAEYAGDPREALPENSKSLTTYRAAA